MPNKAIITVFLALLIPIPACAQDVNSQLIEAAQNGQADKVEALLEAGADANAKDNVGVTALMRAARTGDSDTVQALLDAGAEVNGKDNVGVTALMRAARTGDSDTVRALLDAGAEVSVNDKDGTARTVSLRP